MEMLNKAIIIIIIIINYLMNNFAKYTVIQYFNTFHIKDNFSLFIIIIIIIIIINIIIIIIIIIIISNSNWTEWSTIQGVIARVISKSDERQARGRFENTSAITP